MDTLNYWIDWILAGIILVMTVRGLYSFLMDWCYPRLYHLINVYYHWYLRNEKLNGVYNVNPNVWWLTRFDFRFWWSPREKEDQKPHFYWKSVNEGKGYFYIYKSRDDVPPSCGGQDYLLREDEKKEGN